MTDLQRRQTLFAEFASKFPHRKVGSLVAVVEVPRIQLSWMQSTVHQYLAAAPLEDRTTPNGLVVPNRDTALEFNLLSRAFYRCMDFLPREHVPSWNVPLNVRVKWNDGSTTGPRGERPTEMRHCDAWLHECPHGVIMQLFVSGASPRNCVRYWEPPADFREEWMGPRTFQEGQEIADRYSPLDYVPRDGEVALIDMSVIHCTHWQQGSPFGYRVSIDTTFALEHCGPGCYYPERQYRGLRAGWDVVTGLGQTHLLTFSNSADDRVDTCGGKRQAVDCNVRSLVR